MGPLFATKFSLATKLKYMFDIKDGCFLYKTLVETILFKQQVQKTFLNGIKKIYILSEKVLDLIFNRRTLNQLSANNYINYEITDV